MLYAPYSPYQFCHPHLYIFSQQSKVGISMLILQAWWPYGIIIPKACCLQMCERPQKQHKQLIVFVHFYFESKIKVKFFLIFFQLVYIFLISIVIRSEFQHSNGFITLFQVFPVIYYEDLIIQWVRSSTVQWSANLLCD